MKFFCTDCNYEFEQLKPTKKEYRDYILGPCWKYVSECPKCGKESNEKIIPRQQKISFSMPQNFCGGGGGCCG